MPTDIELDVAASAIMDCELAAKGYVLEFSDCRRVARFCLESVERLHGQREFPRAAQQTVSVPAAPDASQAGLELARLNSPNAKRTIVSSIPDFDF